MLVCKKCSSVRLTVGSRHIICSNCGHTETTHTMIQREMKPPRPEPSSMVSPQRNEAYTQIGHGCFQKRSVRYA